MSIFMKYCIRMLNLSFKKSTAICTFSFIPYAIPINTSQINRNLTVSSVPCSGIDKCLEITCTKVIITTKLKSTIIIARRQRSNHLSIFSPQIIKAGHFIFYIKYRPLILLQVTNFLNKVLCINRFRIFIRYF